MAARTLSLIIPAYKQEKTITKELKELDKALSSIRIDYELILVVDGFVDKTFQIAKKLNLKKLIVDGYSENKGKGFAIKRGVTRAKGDIIGFIDSGMDLDPTTISLMLDIMAWNKADIVIGSKLHPDSKVNYPPIRKVLSWGYRNLVRVFFNFNVKDTQVGLKLFRKKVAKDVFPRIIVKTFAFDVEVLAVARKLGYKKIYEAPVKFRFKQNTITNASFWKIVFFMLLDTLAVFYRMNILNYYDRK